MIIPPQFIFCTFPYPAIPVILPNRSIILSLPHIIFSVALSYFKLIFSGYVLRLICSLHPMPSPHNVPSFIQRLESWNSISHSPCQVGLWVSLDFICQVQSLKEQMEAKRTPSSNCFWLCLHASKEHCVSMAALYPSFQAYECWVAKGETPPKLSNLRFLSPGSQFQYCFWS